MTKADFTSPNSALGAGLGAVLTQGVAQGAGPLGHFLPRLARLPLSALEVLLMWQARASERHRLGQMDDRLLADMGLSHADVARESAIPFWRAS